MPFDSPLPARAASNPLTAALSFTYAAVVHTRNFAYDSLPALSCGLGRPVISIGGIRAGGTGKTPVAQLVGRHITGSCGCGAAFLSRGYGRVSRRPVIVKPGEPADWRETGDEPCMLHANIPESWLGISPNRAAIAKKLLPQLPSNAVFILDDGFQHRRVRRDLNIVCLSDSTFGDRLMPAGYLRESVTSLYRADVVLVIGAQERIDKLREVQESVERLFAVAGAGAPAGADARQGGNTGRRGGKTPPICAILLQYPESWVEARTGRSVDAGHPPFKNPAVISGIARPERFISMLRTLSVEPSEVRTFGDHHKFKINDLAPVHGHDIYYGDVVTTEKDAVRLMSPEFSGVRSLWYLKVGLRFADAGAGAQVLSTINCVCHKH